MDALADMDDDNSNPYAGRAAGNTPGQAATSLKLVLGLGVAGLVGGAVLGATVLRRGSDADVAAAAAIDVAHGATWDCPGGAVVGDLRSGDRVYVIGRDEAGEWSAIRDPRALDSVVWVPAASLEPDSDDRADVPVRTCEQASVTLEAAPDTTASGSTTTTTIAATTTLAPSDSSTTTAPTVPTTASPTVPSTTTAPPQPDTQKPNVQASASEPEIYDVKWAGDCPTTSTLTATATDNVGVVGVTGTFSGLAGSPITFTRSGGSWRADFGPFAGVPTGANQLVSISIVARDAAGNTSNPAVVTVRVWETCLI